MQNSASVLLATLITGSGFGAHALVISPSSDITASGLTVGQTKQLGQAKIDVLIAPYLGSASELYKQNFNGAEEGALSLNYNTSFTGASGDPSGASIQYSGGNFIGGTSFLLIKDGNHQPWWYLFNLTGLGWNGTDALALENFWPAGGSISHVTLYGTSTPARSTTSTAVPDSGASGWLLAGGLVLLSYARRWLVRD